MPIIRLATPEDAAITATYLRALRQEVKDGLSTVPWRAPPSDAEQEIFLRRIASEPHSCVFIAVEDGVVVAMGDIHGGDGAHTAHAGWLGISVAPAWRGKGLGRKLMQALIAEGQSWPEFCRIELLVVPWNATGIALYHSLGFVTEAVKRKAVNLRGVPEDEILMALVW
jgi:RimJ/RimL family protein N-acetyltransferase